MSGQRQRQRVERLGVRSQCEAVRQWAERERGREGGGEREWGERERERETQRERDSERERLEVRSRCDAVRQWAEGGRLSKERHLKYGISVKQ